MKFIAHLLFEARMLKSIPRSGYAFLGAGRESVAEHSYMVTMIAFILSRMQPQVDAEKLMAMCLIHDLPEARLGDINYVQKQYVKTDEDLAVRHMTRDLPFGDALTELIAEYNSKVTLESRLAHDADQLSLIVDLKALSDIGYHPPDTWLPAVRGRVMTDIGREIADELMRTSWDAWWLKNYIDRPSRNN